MSHSEYLWRVQDEIKNTSMVDRAKLDMLSRILADVSLGDITEAETYFNQERIPRPHLRLNRREIVVPTFQVGLSQAFHNKQLKAGYSKSALSTSFIATEVTPEQLIDHILQGKAWTPGIFRNNHRAKDDFIQAQCIGLDFDNGVSVDDANMEYLISEYAMLIHPSASSTKEKPKTRVVFVLSEPVNHKLRYETMTKALMSHFAGIAPDEQTKDASRLFYGSDVQGEDAFPAAVLPISIPGCLLVDMAERDHFEIETQKARQNQPTRQFTQEQASKYVETAYNAELRLVQTSVKGDHHKQLYKSAAAIGGMVRGNWGISEGEAERELIRACGFASDHDLPEITRIIQDAFRVAQPRNLEGR